ncbi:MAG TPA: hypothetical protein ENN67_05550 [Firmicutes bacterium]|nr:hypothetical protein [Bacillota bacterium]
MLKKHYPARTSFLLLPFFLWLIWTVAWWIVPESVLIWGPLKWIFIAIFTPIGLIFPAVLTGYKVETTHDSIRFGFFPFIKAINFADIEKIGKGAVYPLSFWKTDQFIKIRTLKGEELSFPCNDPDEIIPVLIQLSGAELADEEPPDEI